MPPCPPLLPLPLLVGLLLGSLPVRAEDAVQEDAVQEGAVQVEGGEEAAGEGAVLASQTWGLAVTLRSEAPATLDEDQRQQLAALVTDLLRAAPSGRVAPGARERAAALGLLLSRQDDQLLLHEAPTADGRRAGLGLLALRLGPVPAEVLLQAPHPFYDLGTGRIVGALYDAGHARAALFATTQRYAVEGRDPTDDTTGVVQAVTQGLQAALPDPLVVQLHGFSRSTSPADAVVSDGSARSGGALEARARAALAAVLGLDDVRTGDEEWRLAARENVQGRLLSSRVRFLHLELGKATRSRLRRDAGAVAALGGALEALAGRPVAGRELAAGLAWTLPVSLAAEGGRSGTLEVPAGEALRVEVPSDQPLPVVEELPARLDGRLGEVVQTPGPARPVDVRGVPGGLLVPAAEARRLLRITPTGGSPASLSLRRSTDREGLPAWDAVHQAALHPPARRDGQDAADDLPPMPWGSAAARAELVARARAVADPRVRALAVIEALADVAPLRGTTHAFTQEATARVAAGEDTILEVHGPGTLLVELRPRGEERWLRSTATLHLARPDGTTWPLTGSEGGSEGGGEGEIDVAGTGQAWLREARFVPPGRHLLRVAVGGVEEAGGDPGGVDLDVRVRVARRRARLLSPRPATAGHEALDPVSAAELSTLLGDRAQALARWRPWVDEPGALGGLARARVLALSDDPDELRRLARIPDDLGPDGAAVAVDALLARAAREGPAILPPELVAAALPPAAPEDRPPPDPRRLAAWLETVDGPRPPGVALLRAARPLVEGGQPVGVAERELRARTTRFSRLEPEPAAAPAAASPASPESTALPTRTRYTERGPGISRGLVLPGDRVRVELPPWPGRHPVLRMVADGPVAFTLRGPDTAAETWRSPGGPLEIALPAGTWRVEGLEGRLVLADPELSPDARAVYERRLHALPAAWSLPDDRLEVDLRVLVDPPESLRAVLDDGTVLDLDPGEDGRVELPAGAFASTLHLSPRDPTAEVFAAVEARTALGAARLPPPAPVADLDAAMADLAELTARIDAASDSAPDGTPESAADALDARIARARLLGRMGLLSSARRDLAVVLQPLEEGAAEDAAEEPPAEVLGAEVSPWIADPEAAAAEALRRAEARAVAENLAPATPSASTLGPRSAEAALARRGLARVLPLAPPAARAAAIEAAEAELSGGTLATGVPAEPPAPHVAAAAARAWLDAGDLPRAWAAANRAGEAGPPIRRKLRARTRWTDVRFPSAGGVLVSVPRPPPEDDAVEEAPAWRRAREVMLASPWPLDGPDAEALDVLRGSTAQVLRPRGSTLDLDLYCRDEDGPGRPCEVRLVVDEARGGEESYTLTLPDGGRTTQTFPPGTDRVEVQGPGPAHALVLRTLVDGQPVRRSDTLRAHRASPGRPVAYDLAGPALVRIQRLGGEARVLLDDGFAGVLGEERDELVVPLIDPGPARIVVHGRADVRVAVGRERPAEPDVEAPDLDDAAGPPPPPVDMDALLSAVGTPAVPRLRTPRPGGAVEVGAGLHHDVVYYPSAGWTAGEVHGDWLLGLSRGWLRAGGWLRGPGWAGGLRVEGGTTWRRGHLGLRAVAAGAVPPDRPERPTGQVGGEVRARQDLALTPDLDLRLEGSAHALALGEDPLAHVDPRAWTVWRTDHPLHLRAAPSLVLKPALDLRLQLGARAVSNTGPSLDRVGAFGGADLLLGRSTVLALDGGLDRRFADADRAAASWGGRLVLAGEHGIWQGPDRWWRLWAEAGWAFAPARPTAAMGVRLLLPRSRNLRDLPPGSVRFRDLRGMP